MKKNLNRYTIAFYNLENFFDTVNDPYLLDDDFTPNGFKKWNKAKFWNKANKISRTISAIGSNESDFPPILIGLAEVENKNVLKSLLKSKQLRDIDYAFVHFDSPDERGDRKSVV